MRGGEHHHGVTDTQDRPAPAAPQEPLLAPTVQLRERELDCNGAGGGIVVVAADERSGYGGGGDGAGQYLPGARRAREGCRQSRRRDARDALIRTLLASADNRIGICYAGGRKRFNRCR